jgi:S-adenosylmethionine synthetase
LIFSKEFKSEIPESGEDCKVMGVRNKDKIVLTIADGIVSHLTPDLDHYISVKEEIREKVLDLACKLVPDKEIEVYINTADIITKDPKKSKVYLTVTGTSAEAGDDGNTGRGNRANGLITPARQMSLEACAGKNPVSHVGKIYNVAAELIAKKIYEEVKGIREAYVKLVSQIGKPIDKPLLSSVQLITEKNIPFRSIKYEVKEIVKNELKNITNITQLVLNRKIQLF